MYKNPFIITHNIGLFSKHGLQDCTAIVAHLELPNNYYSGLFLGWRSLELHQTPEKKKTMVQNVREIHDVVLSHIQRAIFLQETVEWWKSCLLHVKKKV